MGHKTDTKRDKIPCFCGAHGLVERKTINTITVKDMDVTRSEVPP